MPDEFVTYRELVRAMAEAQTGQVQTYTELLDAKLAARIDPLAARLDAVPDLREDVAQNKQSIRMQWTIVSALIIFSVTQGAYILIQIL